MHPSFVWSLPLSGAKGLSSRRPAAHRRYEDDLVAVAQHRLLAHVFLVQRRPIPLAGQGRVAGQELRPHGGDGRTVGRVDLFFAPADRLADAGEIAELHAHGRDYLTPAPRLVSRYTPVYCGLDECPPTLADRDRRDHLRDGPGATARASAPGLRRP